MARMEQDREDLMREAVRLVPRGEFLWQEQRVFVGFRPGPAPSFYFSPEEVYQFNSQGELRRAYLQGALYKAQQGHLVRMLRHRTAQQVQLRSTRLSPQQEHQFLEQLHRRLQAFAHALHSGEAQLATHFPPEEDFLHLVLQWLTEHPRVRIAKRPHAR